MGFQRDSNPRPPMYVQYVYINFNSWCSFLLQLPVIQCLIIFIIGLSATILFEYYMVTGEHGTAMQTADVENGAFSRFSQRNIVGELQDYHTPDQSNDAPRKEYGSSQESNVAVGTQRGQLNELRSPGNMDNFKDVLRAKGASKSQITMLVKKMAQGDTDFVKNVLKARGISGDQLAKLKLQQPGQARIDDGNTAARAETDAEGHVSTSIKQQTQGAPDFTYLKQLLWMKRVPEHIIDDIIQHVAKGDVDVVENTLKRIRVDQDQIDQIMRMGSTGNSDNGNNIVETEKQSGIQTAMNPINDDSIQQAKGNTDSKYLDLTNFLKRKGASDGMVDDVTKLMAQGDNDYVKRILKTKGVSDDIIDEIIKLGYTGDYGQNIIETKKESGDQTSFIQQQAKVDADSKLKDFLKGKGTSDGLVDDITEHLARGDTAFVRNVLKAKRVPADMIDKVIELYVRSD